MSKNRFTYGQPDYIFVIVQRPDDWRPRNYFDMPPTGKVITKSLVASYDEAHDDLKRCNQWSLRQGLDTWAVIQAVEAQL